MRAVRFLLFGYMRHNADDSADTYTSYIFPKSDAPRYLKAGTILTIFCFLCAICALALRFILQRKNLAADRAEATAPSDVRVNAHDLGIIATTEAKAQD